MKEAELKALTLAASREMARNVMADIHKRARDTSKVNRIELIDDTGRAYVKGDVYGTPVRVELSFQDDDCTLKIFVHKRVEFDDLAQPHNKEKGGE